MNRIATVAALALSASALTGCMTIGGYTASFASIAQVVNEIQCQIWREIAAAGAQSLWSNYRAKLALTVTVTHSTGFDIYGNTYLGALYIYGGYDRDRSQRQVVEVPEISFNLSELAGLDCTTPPDFQIVNLSGGGSFASLFAFANGGGGGGVGRLGDTFSVASSFSLWRSASIEVDDLPLPLDPEFGLGRSRSDQHTAIIAFTRNTAGADARLNEAIDLQQERTDDYRGSSSI